MAQSINLVPQVEQHEQQKVKLVKLSTVFSVVILLVVGGVSVHYLNKTARLKSQIAVHDKNIEATRNQIKKLSEIEIVARNLGTRSKSLMDIFDSKAYYSLLLKEFKKRLPSAVTAQNFTMSVKNTFTISGDADNYIAIAGFINDLTDPEFEGAEKGLEALFTNVTLNSVSLEGKSNRANYFLTVTYDANKLKK